MNDDLYAAQSTLFPGYDDEPQPQDDNDRAPLPGQEPLL